MMHTGGSAPCPVCDATGTDWDGSRCRACEGTLWIPIPWRLPEDEALPAERHFYTSDESAIVTTAPTTLMAMIGYYAVYGSTVSEESIRQHRKFCRLTGYRPRWSDNMEAIVEAAPSVGMAIMRFRGCYPEEARITDKAIEHRWRALHAPPPRT